MLYLDNSATTRPTPAVREAVAKAMAEDWYNPSALYGPALGVEKQLNACREILLNAAGAKGQRVTFTGSGTEADNLAILGTLRTQRQPGRVLMLEVEHPAVLTCGEELRRLHCAVEHIPVDSRGVADLAKLEAMLDSDVRLICVMQVNNETGAVQPLAEIAALRDRLCPGAPIHVDGVQGFLRVPLAFNRLNIQSYALSGHKIHALKGVGALISQRDRKLSPVVFGGGQEGGLRSGTENTPGILSLKTAVETWPREAPEEMRRLKLLLWEEIKARIPAAVVNGPEPDSGAAAPHILNVSFPPVRSQPLLLAMEGEGVCVSAGSACASHKQKVSGVLSAMGVGPERADSALRFSLCPGLTEADMRFAAEALARQYALLSQFVRR